MAISTTRAHIAAGKLLPVAISSEKRLVEFPDMPTLVELGYPDLVAKTWFSLSGPAGLPRDIVDKLNAAVNKAITIPEVHQHLKNEMVETQAMTPEQITAFMQSELNKWSPLGRRISEQAKK
jgi:tripartite-type tricarboxylate transporter receptor subunit TctC